MAPKTYDGNCHCGVIEFSVVLPALESTPLTACNCTICTKKGYLFVFPLKSAFTATKGAGADGLGHGVLADYAFNSKQLLHRFCSTCGTPFGIVRADLAGEGNGTFALNTRMLRGVDLWALQVNEHPGPVTPLEYTVPKFAGLAALEQGKEGGEKVYGGSCHCGAVTFALKSPGRLDEKGLEGVSVQECDCSICIRHAGIYTYPRPLSRVPMDVSPPDALVSYFYPLGKKFGAYQFCGVCGVPLFQKIVGPPPERVAALPENVQAMIREKCAIKPVSLRALTFFLGRSEEDRAERTRVEKAVVRGRGSQEGTEYVVPE
ncbi:Mss4-like protein [Mycena sp. CBHHK59/15]|nr:Mss4-like protein [Mycena sp. CBHHK59/15]